MRRRAGTFELRVFPRRHGQYGIELAEATRGGNGSDSAPHRVVRVWGRPFEATLDRTLAAVRSAGGRPSDLKPTRKAPFHLDEETGVSLGLLLLAVKPLKKMARIEAVREATSAMAPEEAYYWYAKCSSPQEGGRAQKALRVLLARE